MSDGNDYDQAEITLYGSDGDVFQEAKAALAEKWGVEPSNPEVVRMLIAKFDPSDVY